jgi:hypothetical protein
MWYNVRKSRKKRIKKLENKELSKLKRRLKTLHDQLGKLGPMMRGSVVVIGANRKKQPYFSLNKNKKTKMIYLGKKREKEAREYSDNYNKLLEIVEEMTEINMTLLKEKYATQKNKTVENL